MKSKIEAIEVIPLRIPFSDRLSAKNSGAAKSSVDVAIVRLRSSDGVIGIGETQAWRRQGSAEYLPNLVRVIRDLFAPKIVGRSPFDIAAIMHDLGQALYGSFYPQAAVSDALHDLAARLQGISVCELLGGRCRDRIRVGLAILVSGEFGKIRPVAEDAFERGYRHMRLKIGGGIAEDMANFAGMREVFGDRVALRGDANGTLRFDEALPLLARLEQFGLEMVEQPVGLGDIEGMAALARATSIPISADESLSSEASLVDIIQRRAASMVQTKIGKNGGLYYCNRLWTIAHAAGLAPLAGNHPTTSVAATAMAHLAASVPWTPAVGEFSNGPTDVLADDIVTEPMRLEDGTVRVPEGPGLGVDLDEDKLRHYAADL
ncbi:MAG: mandelate racemase/muconate lactonizing enzyme family protein [Hyphomicrobiales bacterium]